MGDINIRVPALEKLMDYVASGVGAIAKPLLAEWKARKYANAEKIVAEEAADAMRIIAKVHEEIKQEAAKGQYLEKVSLEINETTIKQKVEFQERKRIANIKSIAEKAAEILGDKEVPPHEPDHDWTARFFNDAQDVSSEEMREIWAKILAGEVESPGRTSLRTLEILKNITKRDAEIFNSACSFVIDNKFIFYNYTKISCEDILYLEELGLVSAGMDTVMSYDTTLRGEKVLEYHGWLIKFINKSSKDNITIPVCLLTSSGREMFHLIEGLEPNMGYLQEIATYMRQIDCEIRYYCGGIERFEGPPAGFITRDSYGFQPIIS